MAPQPACPLFYLGHQHFMAKPFPTFLALRSRMPFINREEALVCCGARCVSPPRPILRISRRLLLDERLADEPASGFRPTELSPGPILYPKIQSAKLDMIEPYNERREVQ